MTKCMPNARKAEIDKKIEITLPNEIIEELKTPLARFFGKPNKEDIKLAHLTTFMSAQVTNGIQEKAQLKHYLLEQYKEKSHYQNIDDILLLSSLGQYTFSASKKPGNVPNNTSDINPDSVKFEIALCEDGFAFRRHAVLDVAKYLELERRKNGTIIKVAQTEALTSNLHKGGAAACTATTDASGNDRAPDSWESHLTEKERGEIQTDEATRNKRAENAKKNGEKKEKRQKDAQKNKMRKERERGARCPEDPGPQDTTTETLNAVATKLAQYKYRDDGTIDAQSWDEDESVYATAVSVTPSKLP